MDGPRTAVVLVEFQGQWLQPGVYRALISRQLRARDPLAAAQVLTSTARAAMVPVVHAPLVIDRTAPRGVLGRLTRGQVFTAGTWRAALAPEVFEDGDVVVRGRTGFDAFVDSDLEQRLLERGIRTVLLAGSPPISAWPGPCTPRSGGDSMPSSSRNALPPCPRACSDGPNGDSDPALFLSHRPSPLSPLNAHDASAVRPEPVSSGSRIREAGSTRSGSGAVATV